MTNSVLKKCLSFLLSLAAAALSHADINDVTPAAACNYLATIGLRTTTYRQQADGEFRCISPAIDIGTNNIAYSVTGGEKSVREMKLLINVYNPREAAAIHRRLKDVASSLAQRLGIELPAAIQTDLSVGSGAEARVNNRKVAVLRLNQSSGDAYTVTVLFN